MKVKVKVTMTVENADEDSVEKQGNKEDDNQGNNDFSL